MAKLIMSLDGAVIREVPLDRERVTIGRKAHNDVQIDNLAVSGEHALIVTILNDSFLEDMGSTNGTLVNGNPVKKHILQSNDVVEIGKYKLKYVSEQGGQTSVADFEKTMVLRAPVTGQRPSMGAAAELRRHADQRQPDSARAADGHGDQLQSAAVECGRDCCNSNPDRTECRQGAGADEKPDDARQARGAGRGHYTPPPWAFHHARRRRVISHR